MACNLSRFLLDTVFDYIDVLTEDLAVIDFPCSP